MTRDPVSVFPAGGTAAGACVVIALWRSRRRYYRRTGAGTGALFPEFDGACTWERYGEDGWTKLTTEDVPPVVVTAVLDTLKELHYPATTSEQRMVRQVRMLEKAMQKEGLHQWVT